VFAPQIAQSTTRGAVDDALHHAAAAIQLAQCMSRLNGAQKARLWIVTRGAQTVDASSSSLAGALQAPLWGIGRTIASELPGLWGGLVELAEETDSTEIADLFDHIWHPDGQSEVAFRAGRRLSARLRPAGARAGRKAAASELRIRDQATYLITGGLGGLGIQVARTLVERGARHLALLGRRAETERSAQAVAELRRAGAQVVVLQADVGNYEQLAVALAQLEKQQPPVAGVVHAAGTLRDALIGDQDWHGLTSVFVPKVLGALNLDALLRDRPMDFVVHFSSVAALIGNHGQANYAAANAFLDALASLQRRAGRATVSVNWGPWGEVGMAADMEDEFYQRWGLHAIEPRQGAELALSLTTSPTASVAVMPCDWQQFARNWTGSRVPSPFVEVVRTAGAGVSTDQAADLRQRVASLPREERRASLLDSIRTIVADILGIEGAATLHADQRLEDFGVDSLLSMAVIRALQTHLGATLAMNSIILYPTLNRLVDFILVEFELDAENDEPIAAQ
jgi:NAD(P)-dependent dehydrogenase (short-subunit alcohol dehydrogenase family)/acyl carrier protein